MHTLSVAGLDPKHPERVETHTFPGSFAECTAEQLGHVATIAGLAMPAHEDPEVVEYVLAMRRMNLLAALTGAGAALRKLDDPSAFVFATDDGPQVLPQLSWAFGEMVWEHSLVPQLMVDAEVWIGPNDGMENFSVKRWGYTDVCLQALGNSMSGEALNNLLGCMYVPAGQAWNSADVEARGKRLAGVPDVLKVAAVANYRALRAALAKRYPNAFGAGGEQDPHGIHGLIVDIAGPKFGDTRSAETAPLHDVLIHVEKLRIAYVEAENKIMVPEDMKE